ncbi:MAG: redox-sensing transcriptional repressor [Glaciecola sp.]|jgi:redox-sensing transcriptional repressor
MPENRHVSPAVIARLPVYWRVLAEPSDEPERYVASEMLSQLTGITEPTIRRDLWTLGIPGTRGRGYRVDALLAAVGARLGVNTDTSVAIFGLGNLGQALASYPRFAGHNTRVVLLFDADPSKVGDRHGDLPVHPVSAADQLLPGAGVDIGIVATPAHAAQDVAEVLVRNGVGAVLNFAPTILEVPDGVAVRNVDLSVELQVLSYYQRQIEARTQPSGAQHGSAVAQANSVSLPK